MAIKERMRIGVVDQSSDHAGNTAMLAKIAEECGDVGVLERLGRHLRSDVFALEFLGQSISDFGICEYTGRVHNIRGYWISASM